VPTGHLEVQLVHQLEELAELDLLAWILAQALEILYADTNDM